MITFALRLIIKDGVHHPPLNHFFSTVFVSFFGINHFILRLAYLMPFWIFLIILFKLIRDSVGERYSMIFILSVSTFPLLLLGSTTPDHALWSSLLYTYLLFYFILKKNIDYRFCIFIISIGILFRVTIFYRIFLYWIMLFCRFFK